MAEIIIAAVLIFAGIAVGYRFGYSNGFSEGFNKSHFYEDEENFCEK